MVERLENSIKIERQRRIQESDKAKAEHRRIASLEKKGSVYISGILYEERDSQEIVNDEEFIVIPSLRGVQPSQIVCSQNIIYCLTSDFIVYKWEVDENEPIVIERLIGEEIVCVSAGSSHAIASSIGGDVFIWGSLILEYNVKEPILMDSMPETAIVTSVSSGKKHNCALTDKGLVYSWGDASDGRLGLNQFDDFVSSPQQVPFPMNNERVTKISCGALHVLAVTSSFQLFSWGSGAGGRLGHGNNEDKNNPVLVTELSNLHCLDIAAGTWHSVCIAGESCDDETGDIFTWGTGCYGQLAHEKCTTVSVPKIVDYFLHNSISAKKVFCGSYHCAMINSTGDLFTWGSNTHGCLGRRLSQNSLSLEYSSKPGRCPGFREIVEGIEQGQPKTVCCGKNFTLVGTHPI